MKKDILIWGAGAIGGTLGAYLLRAGYDVTFVDIDEAHVAAINDPQRGLTISGPIDNFTQHAAAFTPATPLKAHAETRWSRIFLAVKSHHTLIASETLQPFLAEDGFVLSVQNGLCEKTIASVVGEARTLGSFVNFGADWTAPGQITYSNRAAVVVGELDGQITPRVVALHQDICHFEPDAILTSDINAYLWGKLGYASLLFAQAVGEVGIADSLARQELWPLWRELAGEVVAVGRANGIALKSFNGFNPEAFDPEAPLSLSEQSIIDMVEFNRPNVKTHSGIWRDLAIRKRTTEVDGQLGEVVRIGAELGIKCPKTEGLIQLIKEIEQGKRPLSDSNILELLEK